ATNALIWISFKPILKLAIPAAIGCCLTRAGLFPVPASRGASQLILNCMLPALLFSKIVPSITPENAKAIGPIFLVGSVYMLISMLLGVLVRMFFPTPRNFRWGLIAAATWSNWGDVPTSIAQTVCGSAPFSGPQDANLAIAYVAIFILIFYITLFPLRGLALIQRDYSHPARLLSDEEEVERTQRSRLHSLRAAQNRVGKVLSATFAPLHRQTTSRSIDAASVREIAGAAHAASPAETTGQYSAASGLQHRRPSQGRRAERDVRMQERLRTIVGSPTGSVIDDEEITEVGTQSGADDPKDSRTELERDSKPRRIDNTDEQDDKKDFLEEDGGALSESADEDDRRRPPVVRILLGVKNFGLSLLTPPTISLVLALVCALVKPLKALFTAVPDYGWHPTAPDGEPPLSILLDTATFLGNASVPLGLLVLGSTLGRMRIPRPVSRLPISSICALAIAKCVILPIIGFVFVRALATHTSIVREDNHVLQYVMLIFASVPTATTQVALTVVNGESNADVLAAYLIVQYIVFCFSSVILTAVSLRAIF
ncbi:auxin efflux carrier, partial [Rhodotorula sp. JG-1b]